MSAVPRNWTSVIGRDGAQLPQPPPTTQSKSTGATAAITSAASQASRYDMAPPLEQPDAKIRFESIQACVCSVEIIALTKPTSSPTPLVQHPPPFQAGLWSEALGSPCG